MAASQGAASLTPFHQSNRQKQGSVDEIEQLPHEDNIQEDHDDDVIGDNGSVLFSEEVDDGRNEDDHDFLR